jgi:hypothetical protein
MIETPHSETTCYLLVDQVNAMGYLHHFDWGCAVGVHMGWAIIEAESEQDALLTVPSIVRESARAIRLIKYTPEMMDDLHHG